MNIHGAELSRPLRVVVADDDEQIRAVVGDLLDSDPRFHFVVAVADGHQAVDAVADHLPDVVLLDVSMPRMDGIQAVAAIRARSTTVGVVMCSAEPDRKPEALQVGARQLGEQAGQLCQPD